MKPNWLPSRTFIRRGVERALRLQIVRDHEHGHRDCTDIRNSGCLIDIIFDVGANIGQSAEKFREEFRDARIHSFEPVSGTFETLVQRVGGERKVSCHRLALGNQVGQATMHLTGAPNSNSSTNSLVDSPKSSRSETVEISTVDEFARRNGIPRVDLLKIDAEGFDLQVLMGSEGLLSSQRVAFVLAEVGFHPGDERHVLFDDVRSYLAKWGFDVFGFYEQQPEWSGEQRLRYANVCYSNENAFTRRT